MSHGDTEQPPPTPSDRETVWELVLRDIADRRKAGVVKYGTELRPFNGRDALVDAYQEALDLVVYLRQAIEERNVDYHAAVAYALSCSADQLPVESVNVTAIRIAEGIVRGDHREMFGRLSAFEVRRYIELRIDSRVPR